MVQVVVGPLLYGGATVPGMRLDGERLVGSRTIMRRLDALAPEPPLLPADPAARERVLEAERWGDEVFQSVPRRILDACFLRDAGAMESYAADAKLPLPRAVLRPALPLTAKLMAGATTPRTTSCARRPRGAAGPPRADRRVDRARGCSAARSPTPQTSRSAPPIRLLETIGDVRPLIEGHPAADLTRYFPPMVGEIPAGTLPAEWLPARAAAA